ncbi:RNA pseudouridine synthase 4, mitochondrial isoform X2 [Durio zibethinus]|uniref:RNA pseudouridine synthase 4, mitochondrial isoform X2 n=1 Tax=Durio zibethinus TaxID=66656 RepID=A0A6P5Z8Q0_DURZI|nr:RNA pseudouridine synthase 4, mitochondrial isoform X2 [Durio zibethinus]
MAMLVGPNLLRRLLRLQPSAIDGGSGLIISVIHQFRSHYSTTAELSADHPNDEGNSEKKDSKWFTLPPFAKTVNASVLRAKLAGKSHLKEADESTAIKWVLKCCPELPRSLVQKLFRLRQVRRESKIVEVSDDDSQVQRIQLKRDSLNIGDRIFLPITVREFPEEKQEHGCTDEELNFIRNLELYKDPAIIVLNKPPGMPVQGGIGIKWSLDELAATWLCYDYSEPPRLVHRLDRDCSGILVMGRTQTSARILHSVFREETIGVSEHDFDNEKRILQKKYWALVIGSPRRPKGTISAPLRKVVVDDGKSDRITVFDNTKIMSSQHAITEYSVIKTSSHGYTWLELSPLTGRKHQLRVHCAEILGTPIVGDYKYGWQAHRRWQNLPESDLGKNSNEKFSKENSLPFGLNMNSGSILEKRLRLHLHCREMILPNVSQALQYLQSSTDHDLSKLKSLEIVAPLPSYMQKSWDILNS